MAIVPNPRTWGSTELVTAAKLNADVRDSFNFLLAPPRAALKKSSLQDIPSNAETAVTWDVELYDSDNGHSNVTNPSRYTAQTAGWFCITANVHWYQVTEVGMLECVLVKNGNTATRQSRADLFPTGTDGFVHFLCGHVQMVVGDYVELRVYQEQGATKQVDSVDTRFDIRWVHS
ncbi:hypothetical protein [Nonomuraea sp. NPDC023979]|uniref:hypothetical protein n=1 Tax=Nonomuraea sp. NPDC023979 TaxID=3154796 RepID=UPI0033FF3F01